MPRTSDKTAAEAMDLLLLKFDITEPADAFADDLDMTCKDCRMVVGTVGRGDTLYSLVNVALDHTDSDGICRPAENENASYDFEAYKQRVADSTPPVKFIEFPR